MGKDDLQKIRFSEYASPVLHREIEHVSPSLPVVGYEMQMPSVIVHRCHVRRTVEAYDGPSDVLVSPLDLFRGKKEGDAQ